MLAFDFVEFRQHEFLDQPAPARDGLRFAAHLDMLNQVPAREFGDRGGVGGVLRRRLGIFASLDAGDHLGGLPPGLVGGHHAMPVDRGPS